MSRIDDLISQVEDAGLKEKLIAEANRITSQKQYGIVWENKSEKVVTDCEKKLPILCERKDLVIQKSEENNTGIIIEGDNYHALSALNYTHTGAIDVIYIDPPYNNGKNTWKYNNNYVDKNDVYRHSKWLSMMQKRMSLAKNLLKEDGVFICAIDENELETLLMLIEHVFGDDYTKDTITVIHNPRGIQGDNFSYVHEYAIFVYRKGQKVVATRQLSEEEIDWSPLRNWGDESERLDAANCFYPIFVKDGQIVGFGDDVTSNDSIHPNQTEYNEETKQYEIWPIDVEGIERKWRYARQSVESIRNLLRVKKTDNGFDIELGKDYAPYRTVWTDKKFDANEYGTQLINSMIPKNDFDFPKSLYTVYECLEAVTKNKPNATVLDYFAGSGTTGHATLLLNKNLGGHRNFILCSNNEVGEKKEKEFKKKYHHENRDSLEWKEWEEQYGIARSITYMRMASAINGFVHKKDFKTILLQKKLSFKVLSNAEKLMDEVDSIITREQANYSSFKKVVEDDCFKLIGVVNKGVKIEGLSSNLRYFKTDYVEKSDTLDRLRRELAPACEDLIRIREGAFEQIVDEKLFKVFKNKRGLSAIIFDRFDLEEYIERIELIDTDSPVHLYVFSYSNSDRSDEIPIGVKHIYENQPIPEGVLEIYKKIFTKG